MMGFVKIGRAGEEVNKANIFTGHVGARRFNEMVGRTAGSW